MREDECEALRAIYGFENVAVARDDDGSTVVELTLRDGAWRASATLPVGYPSARAPTDAYALAVRGRGAREREIEAWASGAMETVWLENLREPCVYAWAEAVVARAEAASREGESADAEEEDGDGVDASTSDAVSLADVEAELAAIEAEATTEATAEARDERRDAVRRRLTSHEPVTEKKSVFQAHVCRGVESVEEVEIVMDILNESRKVRAATHNILAYRVTRPDGSFYQDHDDDGETAAGGRLLRLLVLADARDVVVVVSRWYGGVHLGPARFHVINNTAKVALESLGEIHQST